MNPFYPSPNHAEHLLAEKQLERLCRLNGWQIEDCDNYYLNMSQKEIDILARDFSEDALRIRSQPDKHIFTKTAMITIDLKSTVRKDTGNISIELSSYYFSWTSYDSLFAYLSEKKLRFFSPKNNNPHTLFIQPKWLNNRFFGKVVSALKKKNPYIKIRHLDTQGSGDPFILLNKKEIHHVVLV